LDPENESCGRFEGLSNGGEMNVIGEVVIEKIAKYSRRPGS
jgi:hypothetical protein